MERFRKWKLQLIILFSNWKYLIEKRISNTFGKTSHISSRWLKFIGALLLSGMTYGYIYDNNISPIFSGILITLVFYIGLSIIEKVVKKVESFLVAIPLPFIVGVVALGYGLYKWLNNSSGKGMIEGWEVYVFISLVLLLEWFFSLSVSSIFKNKKKNLATVSLLLVTLFGNVLLGWFLFTDGTPTSFREELIALGSEGQEETIKRDEEYKVLIRDYGNGAKITSKEISLYPYVNYSGMQKKVRDFYWKKDLSEVPISGRVYTPEGVSNAPLLVFVHGNHRMTEENHLGYDYLGNYLAARGIAMVSVNENMLNGFLMYGLGGENDARAILLLENIKWLLEENKQEDSVFYQAFDETKLALGGHSRGGEAAAIATKFQSLERYPDNGNRKLDYDFGVKTVIAVSPTFGQYNPAGHNLILKDVDYLTIHGSHDGDVNTFQGEEQYQNVVFTGKESRFKTALYLGFANHGQFNTRWGKNDQEMPKSLLYHKGDIMNQREQEELLCLTMDHFLRASWENKGREFFAENLGKILPWDTVYFSEYKDESFVSINTFEEDDDLTTTTHFNGINDANGCSTWKEDRIKNSIGTKKRNNHGVTLAWGNTSAYYSTKFDPLQTGEANKIQCNIMNLNESLEPVDFSVELVDANGVREQLPISEYRTLLPSIPVGLLKIQHITENFEYKKEFQTVRIPIKDFKEKQPEIDLNRLTEINFMFNLSEKGNIIIDDIGISH